MIFYEVTNGNHTHDYYQEEKSAQKEVDNLNEFIERSKDSIPQMDPELYYVKEIETAD